MMRAQEFIYKNRQKFNIILLVDTSRSMQGERIGQVNQAISDISKYTSLMKEHKNLEPLVEKYREYKLETKKIEEATLFLLISFEEITQNFCILYRNNPLLTTEVTSVQHYNSSK